MNLMFILWMIVAGAFLILELFTAALCSIWFTVGAVAALAVTGLKGPVWLQILVFFLVSAACFALMYPRIKKHLNQKKTPTNADMTIGAICVVTQVIDNISGTGAVTTGGKTWTARSVTGDVIEEGRMVRAIRIEGVKLMVTPLPEYMTAEEETTL